ncbi:hypothetical protein ABZ897_07280 [Nonomuraea sp. NPDC046802]|uniref:hypothetical protein n=1 Tax=Nonomuraea sp. NPDC046802 TaxID=3154919 RepID=UPI00340076D6
MHEQRFGTRLIFRQQADVRRVLTPLTRGERGKKIPNENDFLWQIVQQVNRTGQ